MAEDTGLASANVSAGDDGLASQYNNLRTDIKILRQLTLTAGATIDGTPTPKPVYLKDSDNKVYQCDGNDIATVKFIGFAITDSTDTNPIIVQHHGVCGGFSSLDIGKYYYVDDSGALATTAGTYKVLVGLAVSATEILIMREPIVIRAQGATSGNSSTTQNIAHGMGVTPNRVRITAFKGGSSFNFGGSVGVYNGSATATVTINDNNSGASASVDTTNIININTDTGTDNTATASFDATNITLTWASSSNSAIAFLWEAEAII